ncbi:MAG: DUF5915 domain-containing protein, partial [Myxococcales bacterium]|nr:DUF5915 domain-containing protein [Myxococcales bacterium]
PRLGPALPALRAALQSVDAAALAARLQAGQPADVVLADGTEVRLEPEEVQLRLHAREGFAAASDRGRVVVLDTRIDEELRSEGMARELVSRLNQVRKSMQLPYEARIEVRYEAAGPLAEVLARHDAYVREQTLCTRLDPVEGPLPPEAETHELEVDGTRLKVWVSRAG